MHVWERITEDFTNLQRIITEKYGREKAGELMRKASEVSIKREDNLEHRRAKKLSDYANCRQRHERRA